MTSLTTDQGLILPVASDGDNVPTAFTDFTGGLSDDGVESRLVKRYLSAADRTVRNPSPNTGEISFRADGPIYEWYTGSAWETLVNPADWTTYTPTWTSTGTLPSIGNGTIEGRYLRMGPTILCTGRILMGSTTSFGTGTYVISLPVTAAFSTLYPGAAFLNDSGTSANRRPGVTVLNTASDFTVYGPTGVVNPTVPFTWAQSDVIQWSITYEAA